MQVYGIALPRVRCLNAPAVSSTVGACAMLPPLMCVCAPKWWAEWCGQPYTGADLDRGHDDVKGGVAAAQLTLQPRPLHLAQHVALRARLQAHRARKASPHGLHRQCALLQHDEACWNRLDDALHDSDGHHDRSRPAAEPTAAQSNTACPTPLATWLAQAAVPTGSSMHQRDGKHSLKTVLGASSIVFEHCHCSSSR